MRKLIVKLALLTLATQLCLGITANAQTSEATKALEKSHGIRGAIFCYPVKGVPKIVERINAVETHRRDVVDVKLDPKFLIKDGGAWPKSFYLAKDGEPITYMPFSRQDGRTPTFLAAIAAQPDADICVDDPTRADKPANYEGLYFEMGLSPRFNSAIGEHNMADIAKASRDGKNFYKKMIPSVYRMFMPNTKHLAVIYKAPALQAPGARAEIFARVDQTDIPLEFERHKEMFVVSGTALAQMGASALIVRGGAYDLQPVPSPSVLRQFDKAGKGDEVQDKQVNAE